MKSDYYFHVADPQVVAQKGSRSLVLRFQAVEVKDGQAKRSGEYVHLELNNAFAMQLLGTLRAVQDKHELPDPGEATQISIPPAEKRN